MSGPFDTPPINRSSAGNGLWLDVRHALRVLGRTRGFTLVAILSLAIGIGANAAIFSVIRVLLLDRMAVRAPEELSFVNWHQPGKFTVSQMNSSGGKDEATGLDMRSNYSYPLYQAMRAAAQEPMQLSGFNFLRDMTVQYADQPAVRAGGIIADGHFFPVLAPRMALGRALGEGDDEEGGPVAVVLSHAFWMRVFGGDPAMVGKSIRINGVPAQVVGVTDASFRGLTKGGFFPQTDVTLPLRAVPQLMPNWGVKGQRLLASGQHFWVRLLARAPAGSNLEALTSRLPAAIGAHLAPVLQGSEGAPARLFFPSAQRGLDQTGKETRTLLYLLMGVVGMVLLIACINLASMMLARGVARQREMSVRRALGAGRARLLRGWLIEGVILALAGGAGGLVLTYWSRKTLTTMLTAGIGTAPLSTQPLEVTIDLSLIAMTFGLSLVAALLFSLLPAVRLTRASAAMDVRHQAAGAPTPKLTMGRLLVALQIGASIPLVVGAILFLRTLANLGAVELGFNPKGIAFFKIDAAKVAPDPIDQAAVYQNVLNRMQAISGVTSASLVENVLLSGWTSSTTIRLGEQESSIYTNAVGPGFFDTMGMTLVAGRAIGIQDRTGAPDVGILNQTAARTFFGSTSPVGQVVTLSRRKVEIVGVVADSLYDKQRGAVRPTLFDSAMQKPGYGGHHVIVRTTMAPEQLEPELRRAVALISRDLPVPEIKSQVAQMQESTIRERVFTRVLTLFGGFALLLACIGLHGVTSYSVARRTSEMGIRLALGAQRRQVLWLVQRQVFVLALIGLVIGVPLAVLAAPVVGSLLFGVAPTDYLVIATAAIVMLIVATVAGLMPARRAANLDPLKALRTE